MEKIITLDITEDFIKYLSDYIDKNYLSKGAGIDRLAFVFGGKRPSLFLKKELSRKTGKGYLPPRFFAMEEFIEHIVSKKETCGRIPQLDDYFTIYRLAQEFAPSMLKNKETFRKFMPWAREISKFMEQLDLEMVDTKSLGAVEKVAEIGYDVPANINNLFKNMVRLRDKYHDRLNEKKSLSRGMFYLAAAEAISQTGLEEFDTVFFCNLFYMHKAEEKIIKTLYDRNKAVLLFQGSQDDWNILKTNAGHFSCVIKPETAKKPSYELSLYSAFDIHSQVGTAREILKNIKKEKPSALDRTVIVTPDPCSLLPLLCECSSVVKDINVSIGYPLADNPVYTLFKSIFDAQLSRKGSQYYARDYLKVITNPLVKNLRISPDAKLSPADSSMLTRIVVHKIEEVLRGSVKIKSVVPGLFIDLSAVEDSGELCCGLVMEELVDTSIKTEKEVPALIMKQLHGALFSGWEKPADCFAFSVALKSLLDTLAQKSPLDSFPLNRAVVDRLYDMQEHLQNAVFKDEKFGQEDIFRIFEDSLEGEVIAFSGMPLKGLQILGLLETRSLSFDNVIVLDVNESVLPRLRVYEPLIPRDILARLGLNLLEREEEIQRYYFKRLLSSSKNAHLVYMEGGDSQRSRFIEEIAWEEQKKKNSLAALQIPAVSFKVEVLPEKRALKKDGKVIEYLKKHVYSASSLDTYLDCSLKFYYKYVLKLDENENDLDTPEAVDVGTFVHDFLKEAYEELRGREFAVSREFRGRFNSLLDKRFEESFAKRMDAEAFMLKEVVNHKMKKFLEAEKKREVEVRQVLELEKQCDMNLKFNSGLFAFTGKVDRIDRLNDGTILVIDYKTGGAKKTLTKSVLSGKLEMTRDSITDVIVSFQLPLYLHFMKKEFKDRKLDAGLYLLRESRLDRLFGAKETVDNQMLDTVLGQSFNAIEHIICKEILNPDVPFSPDTKKDRSCSYCPFFYLCR